MQNRALTIGNASVSIFSI